MDLSIFITEDVYIDFSSPLIKTKADELFSQAKTDLEKAQIAYEYVRDEVPHSFDIGANVITARASDVLGYMTGICHAKANLLAALLRSVNIPTGFCFQHITLSNDESLGYCVHCFNAIFIDNHWIKVDARGNTKGKNAQFSIRAPILAFSNRKEYDEYFWKGIYARPHIAAMNMLEQAKSLQDVLDNIPDYMNDHADVNE